MRLKKWITDRLPLSKKDSITAINQLLANQQQYSKLLEELAIFENHCMEKLTVLENKLDDNLKKHEILAENCCQNIEERQTQFREELLDLNNSIKTLEEDISTFFNNYEHKSDEINRLLPQMLNLLRMNKRYGEENVWAQVFHDVTIGSTWLNDRSFCAGRWAIGYQTLYVLYRILNEIKPMCILELGLGQSTKMISQYAGQNPAIIHRVIEHDREWIHDFEKANVLSENTEIILKPLSISDFNGVSGVRVYKHFAEKVVPQRYDLIIIDAPWGGDMKDYSRVDVANIMPDCLGESFAILIDDYNRIGEQNTVEYMKHILESHHISFASAKYEGAKDLAVIASEDWKHICTF